VAEMKIKSVVLLAVALGCGLVAMLGVQQALSGNKKDKDGVTRVLVATAEINPGMRLDETNSVFEEWPSNAIPKGAVTSADQIEDRALMAYAIPGEIMLLPKFGDKGVFGASNEIPEGMRLATVSVNLTKIHSGLIMPGDHVDLVLTYDSKKTGQGVITRTMTILENVEIFATDSKRTSSRADSKSAEIKAKNISLLVTLEQFQLCMLAESKGQLTLALRNANDSELASTTPVDESFFDNLNLAKDTGIQETQAVEEFFTSLEEGEDSLEEIAEVAVPEPPKWPIKIYEGSQVRIVEVELPQDDSGTGRQSPFLGSDDHNNQKSWWKRFLN
jgi:pilus assembly protein CpaB